jgi:hypothetical protein
MSPRDGFRVEASIIARLLGIRLLKLNATVLVVPSEVKPVRADPGPSFVLRTAAPPSQSGPVSPSRQKLADAVRSINEGAELLAEARRNGAESTASLR